MIYKVLDIIEPDFGCEGLPDGQVPMDEVILLMNTTTKKSLSKGICIFIKWILMLVTM